MSSVDALAVPQTSASLETVGPVPADASPSWASSLCSGAVLLPVAVGVVLLLIWDLAVCLSGSTFFPRPLQVGVTIVELMQQGLLFQCIGASLFRVLSGFALAVLVGVPFGCLMGTFRRVEQAFNPMVQAFRPISPIAWIPMAILWFGMSDTARIFLIFLASVFPIAVSTTSAVKFAWLLLPQTAHPSERMSWQFFRRVVVPAALPPVVTGLRIALGVAWLVMVAAEMITVNSGLGYLILDSRNAANHYDLQVAGMVLIGFIGWLLDLLMRQLERFLSGKLVHRTDTNRSVGG